jgi:CubicO group peptidase (beta-lactamase class C family)
MASKIEVHGLCDERFGSVRKAFAGNFEAGTEVGASFAATIDGKTVVDIWGGHANAERTETWKSDTIVNVFSMTKIMTALCAWMLADRGLLDFDAPVASYWPEFAQNGKDKIPVRFLLSHQSGLAGFDVPVTLEQLYDWEYVTRVLASMKPLWEPGKGSGYHGITQGYLVGEVVRRITGRTLGTFFRDEVARPLGADFHIGLGPEHDHRVASLVPPPVPGPNDPGYIALDPGSVRGIVRANGPQQGLGMEQ